MKATYASTHAACLGALLLVLGTAPPALAGNHSPVSVGVGAGLGVHHTSQPEAASRAQMISAVNVRAKLLWFLGADLSYAYQQAEYAGDDLRFGGKLRATALVYPIPTKWFGVYLGAGIGADRFKELLKVDADSNSYHVGGGVELHLGKRMSIDTSFFMVVPGVASIERDVSQRALTAFDEIDTTIDSPEDLERLRSIDELPIPEVTVKDYLSVKNFEFMVRGIFYF